MVSYPLDINNTKNNEHYSLPNINFKNDLINVKIYRKNFINKNMFFKINKKENLNEILDVVDSYYINHVNEKDKNYSSQEEIKEKHTNNKYNTKINYFVNIPGYNIIIKEIYVKYYEIGKLLQKNYNLENINYFNVKNISMMKNRCNRIYEIINHMKINNIKYITSPIRNIFHAKKNTFKKCLSENLYFI
jgi:hypothetical protein